MEADSARLREWIGRTETAEDWLAPERAQALAASLDRPEPPLVAGDPLPPLRHWLYFWTIVPRSGLGRDGHPALGGFLPPVGRARRMWAGSRISFAAPLALGAHARRVSTIADVLVKSGRSGRLVFVTVGHEISGAHGLAIVDHHDIVYREDEGGASALREGQVAPTGATFAEEVTADATLLFRYSALTFNGHRIHYDRPYATEVEGYSGLVVHGPLLATLMVDLAVRSWPQRELVSFEFRGQRPVIGGRPFTIAAAPEGASALALWIADDAGCLAMRGSAGFR